MIEGKSGLRRIRLAMAVSLGMGMGMAAMVAPVAAAEASEVRAYSIVAGSLDEALAQFGRQSGLQMMVPPELVAGQRAGAVSGNLSGTDVLRQLLDGTGLTWEVVRGGTVVLKKAGRTVPQASRAPAQPAAAVPAEEKVTGMPAVMVKGAKTLNVDIERTIDDPQPYVVFERAEIERSGAVNIEDFFRKRLPMNSTATSILEGGFTEGNVSSVNLRGLGDNQTLILVDGRRLGRGAAASTPQQPDINGIPLDAIERIEILPSTASAIYGGSATGGVINIIMRRDYIGNQVAVTYDNSFDTDSAIRRIDLSSGFSLFGGRTSVLLHGSYTESNEILGKDRDFVKRHYENLRNNHPDIYASTLPLGSGANIRSVDGSNLVLKDGTMLGSSFTSAPDGYGGASSDGAAALLTNAGKYNLDPSKSSVLGDGGNFEVLVPGPNTKYMSGSVRHEFSEDLQGFVEASRSENRSRRSNNIVGGVITLPASASSNPFQQGIQVRNSSSSLDGIIENESVYDRFSGGVIYKLPREWMAAADYTYTKATQTIVSGYPRIARQNLYSSDIASGVIDILADLDDYDWSPYVPTPYFTTGPTEVVSKNPAIRLSGPIGSVSGGKVQVSMLLERQDSTFRESRGTYAMTESEAVAAGGKFGDRRIAVWPMRSQTVGSAYVEMRVPFISSLNAKSWLKELEVQLSGRWDRQVSNVPSSGIYNKSEIQEFSPLGAVRFKVSEDVALRASYSKGFLPPDINQLQLGTVNVLTRSFADPKRGNTLTQSPYEVLGGGNPNLEPERSSTWATGVIYTPSWAEGFRLSIDYTRLRKSNQIASLGRDGILANEDYFPSRIVRGPNLPGDPSGWLGPITRMDVTSLNISESELRAFDVRMDYDIHTTNMGNFSLFLLGTWQTKFETRVVPTAGITDGLGWVSGYSAPLKMKANFGVEWSMDSWAIGWDARYTSSYYVADPEGVNTARVLLIQGNGGRVPSQLYHDAYLRYMFSSGDIYKGLSGALSGVDIQFGVRNIFNKTPSYDYSSVVFSDYYSNFGDARLASYYITIRKSF